MCHTFDCLIIYLQFVFSIFPQCARGHMLKSINNIEKEDILSLPRLHILGVTILLENDFIRVCV